MSEAKAYWQTKPEHLWPHWVHDLMKGTKPTPTVTLKVQPFLNVYKGKSFR